MEQQFLRDDIVKREGEMHNSIPTLLQFFFHFKKGFLFESIFGLITRHVHSIPFTNSTFEQRFGILCRIFDLEHWKLYRGNLVTNFFDSFETPRLRNQGVRVTFFVPLNTKSSIPKLLSFPLLLYRIYNWIVCTTIFEIVNYYTFRCRYGKSYSC